MSFNSFSEGVSEPLFSVSGSLDQVVLHDICILVVPIRPQWMS